MTSVVADSSTLGLWAKAPYTITRVLASRIDGVALRPGRRQGNALRQGRRVRLGGVLRCRRARACDHMPLQPTAIGVVCHKVRVSPRYGPCHSVSE